MSEEARMWTELGRLGQDPLPGERSDADIVAAALAGLAEDAAPRPEPAPTHRRSRWPVIVGVGLAVAAAVIVGAWLLPRTGLLGDQADRAGSMAPNVRDDAPAGGQAVARAPERAVGSGPSSPAVDPETTSDEPTGATAEPAGSSNDTAEPAGSSGPEPAGPSSDTGEPAPASASPRRPVTAQGLLERAQRQVSEGERAAAAGTYARLIERFPGSREATAALVSLGRLELERGRAAQALARFDDYLAGSAGALVEEARYGRIRALRELGRHVQELRSIEAFLGDHPESLYAARLRKRAEELRAP